VAPWVAVALVLIVVPAQRAAADDPPPLSSSSATRYQVTFAALDCDSFDDVMAGQVRGENSESLARPGRDTAYKPGQPVDPDVESGAGDGCEPLVGWRFTLGSGYEHKGALSVVTGATATTPATLGQTARLDAVGRQAGGDLQGAVTVVLTDEQVRLAVRRQLWVQGGTPEDPLLAGAFGAGRYAFGSLRCGVDGRTDGNVQWLGFASGVRHAFCYASYVHGAPKAGAVTVRVRPSHPVGYPQRFPFGSSLSYAAGGFTLTSSGDPAEVTFRRAAGQYPVQAQLPAGWKATDLTCAASRPGGGQPSSTATTDLAAARAVVALAADDLVTCTLTVDPPPLAPGLTLAVYAENGSGLFGLSLDGEGGPRALTAAATDGTLATATGADLAALPAGAFPLNVTPPDAAWTVSAVACDGNAVPVTGTTATLTVTSGVPMLCVVRATRKPGSVQLHVVTTGGVASAAFAAAPADQPVPGWWAGATTTGYGVPAPASGDLPQQLPLGGYQLTPVPPRSTVDGGWQLTAFTCTPGGAADATGTVRLTLTPAAPDVTCTATYKLVAATRLQLVVRADGSADGRRAAAVVEVTCKDGSAGRAVLGVDDASQANLPEPLSFLEPTSCMVTQPANGAVEGTAVDVSALLDPATGNGPLTLPAQVDVVRDVPAYTVTVTDRFAAPARAPHRATLLHSFKVLPAALVGVGMFTLGALVLAGLVLRRRAALR
jgi:hypothetical protein